ncbi:SEC-C domain-containing protein [Peribacillus frigoritolerans]|uniref:SEC-C domain-containing protein n=1 Tax=Peribacillus frigoritolerans TaxID=450367 RepID=UPI0037F13912
MNRNDIIAYLKDKIPDYSCETNLNKHVFQFSVHVYPFVAKRLHPFIENLVNALNEIEQAVPGYAIKTIDWLATIDKTHFEQVIQILGEIIVLRKLVAIANPNSITLEPSAISNGKNPEFRALVEDTFFAIEVKTASLFNFSTERQTGLQITAQLNKLDYQLLSQTGKIVNSRSLKVKDYLVSAEEKFEQYKQNNEFKDDFRLLFIIWDDYINEPLSALANPNCGLLTDNSFYQDSRFKNVDGVILIRHIHQFFRNLQYAEIVDYGKKGVHDSFDYVNPAISAIFIQNPLGREIPYEKLEKFEAFPIVNFYEFPVAEYQPTDFIDWQRGLSISGIYKLPEELKNKIISFFIELPTEEIPLSYRDISLFDNYSIDRAYANLLKEYSNEEKIEEELFKTIKSLIEARQFISKENLHSLKEESDRRFTLDQVFKGMFLQNYSRSLNEQCPCCSEKLFKDCCFDKLRFFNYTHYYDL